MPEHTPTDLAYFAGLLDGEGCLSLNRSVPSACLPDRIAGMTLRITMSNTFRGPLDEGCKLFGGTVRLTRKGHCKHKKYSRDPNALSQWADLYTWTITTKKAMYFLLAVFPYLRIKKKQADAILMFCQTTAWSWRDGRTKQLTKEGKYLRRLAFRAFRHEIETTGAGRKLSWTI